jgi:prepilin-type N-terminal cleavage/methylation domain-containing protein
MKTKSAKQPRGGFTLLEIMLVCGLIGVLVAIAIPNFLSARSNSQANACINNLRQIDSAASQFAIEKGKSVGSTINYPSDLTPYFRLNANSSIPPCPAGGNYAVAPVGADPQVTCSVGKTVSPPHVY